MPSPSELERAAKLKEEGNALYARKQYHAAYSKYSDAIALDANNAVLYANRGACMLAEGKYLDAAGDCRKATQLDPMYIKAWARLGTALKNAGMKDESIAAYRRALSILPPENLSETEKSIKRQCEVDLDALRKTPSTKHHEGIVMEPNAARETPWKRALQMQANITQPMCSAWIILWAYQEFSAGVNVIKQIKRISSPMGGRPVLMGASEGIVNLSNGIMTDPRVFHIDSQDFITKYNMQVEFEVGLWKAFTEAGAQNLITKAPKMLEREGWDFVRPAISTTVRCWILNAFVTNGLFGNPVRALNAYDDAIQALKWGREFWKDVPKEQRGVVFEDTFLRGVKSLRLDCYMKANAADPSAYPLQKLYDDAQDLLREVQAAPKPPASGPGIHPGFILAHYVYPEGQALALSGLYYRDSGKLAQARMEKDEAAHCFQESARFYQLAADVYPPDDENHIYYLCCAYDLLTMRGSYAVKEVLTIAEKVRAAEASMKKIWEYSVLAPATDVSIRRVLAAENDLRREIKSGKYTETSTVTSHFGGAS